jgi:uncharacterized membrane protein YhiD involved in acid resistance
MWWQTGAGTMASAESRRDSGQGLGGAWESLAPVLGALVTGVGLLAFVALFGGAILWDRANQIGLPGTEAVALMPRSELLATGAHFLLGALLVSVIAVAALWLIDTLLRTPEQIVAHAEAAADAFADRHSEQESVARDASDAERALAQALNRERQAQATEDERRRTLETETHRPNRDDALIDATSEALRRAEEVSQTGEEEVSHAKENLVREIVRREERRSLRARTLVLGVLLLLGEISLLAFHPWLDLWQYGALLGVSLGTSLLAVVVYHATDSFTWFAVAAFFAVATFQGLATHFAIVSDPEVEPAAVLIGGQPPIKGVFITQTDDRIYIGIRIADSESTTLVSLHRDLVSGLAVAQPTDSGDAADKLADRLVAILCSQVPIPTTPKERRALPQCE